MENALITQSDNLSLPALISDAGVAASTRFVEFFTAQIRNPNTRSAYYRAATRFMYWCEKRAVGLTAIQPVVIAAYVEELSSTHSAPSVKQHLAALSMLFDWLVIGQVMPFNPAASVRGPKHIVREGKTPILDENEMRELLESLDTGKLSDLRDRAILGLMAYSFARVSALTKMQVKDFYQQGSKSWFILHEKGGKLNKVPAHHKAAEFVEQYIIAAGIKDERNTPLFRSLSHRGNAITGRAIDRKNVFHMIHRKIGKTGLPKEIGCHSFRGTGITNFLQHGGDIETAARIAGHASTRTTQLYDRRNDIVNQGEIERIRF